MKKCFFIFFICFFSFDIFANDNVKHKLKQYASKAQEMEKEITNLEKKLEIVVRDEKNTAPIIKNIYEILVNCFVLLFDIQRSAKFLPLKSTNKNDFVRCSIIIKNFSRYFYNVSDDLKKNSSFIYEVLNRKQDLENKIKILINSYDNNQNKMQKFINELEKKDEDSMLQNIVHHIASKSESIEELDAELESENTIGILKNTKISTPLKMAYPVAGRIVSEFGDKSNSGEMIFYMAFKPRTRAVVTSPVKGLVVFSGCFLNYGKMLIISNGFYRVFIYGIDIVDINIGDVVEIGDYIGKIDNKENPLLKMELKKSGEALDPRYWISEKIGN